MEIHKFLYDNQNGFLEFFSNQNSQLYQLLLDFKSYIDSYLEKLETIYNFMIAVDKSFDLNSFEKKLKVFNKLPRGADCEAKFKKYLDKSFSDSTSIEACIDTAILKRILYLVAHFGIKQEKFMDRHYRKNNFIEHIREFMTYINEEASVLFCYLVKDSFEFMNAPEKKLLIKLNQRFHQFLTQPHFNDDLNKIKTGALSILSHPDTTQNLFRKIVLLLKKSTGIRCIQLLTVSSPSNRLEVKLYSYVNHLPMYDTAHDGGIISEAAKTNKVVCVNSVFNDSRYDVFDATIKSELAIPISVNGSAVAVMNFEDLYLNRFSDEFIQVIQELCANIGEHLITHSNLHSLKKEKVTV